MDRSWREECGIFGIIGCADAARYAALGLHALQHRGQEACGVVAYDSMAQTFNNVRRLGYVRDHFTREEVIRHLPGHTALGHVRYATAGRKGDTAIRDVQPLFAEFSQGGVAIAHNGNLTNAQLLRRNLVREGSIFQSGSDTECIVHLMARSRESDVVGRMKDALRQVEGAFSIVAMTRSKMIGVRDRHGIRPLVLGSLGSGHVFASETCALDIVGAEFICEVGRGEMIVVNVDGVRTEQPLPRNSNRFCIFEHVYFSRPDSQHDGTSVYEVRRRIGAELAKEAPVDADLVCPVPDSGTPAAIGYSQQSDIPFAFGIVRSPFVGRTFIEPTEQIRNMGVRLKLNVNRSLVAGKRLVLVDDSVVRGTTVRKIASMVQEAGAKSVHFRVASPPTQWPCFYGVDTPERGDLLAAQMDPRSMAEYVGVDSLCFVTIDGLYRACGSPQGRGEAERQFCDACFTGDYPIVRADGEQQPSLPMDTSH